MSKTKIVVRNDISWPEYFKQTTEKLFKKGTILDIGGGAPFYKEMDNLKHKKMEKVNYICLDYAIYYKPDIVGDAHFLPFKNNSADLIILKSVLEHVENPFRVMEEIKRVLKPGGKLLLWVPFLFPYHADKNYKDYYRFSQDGVINLLNNFSQITIIPTRGYFETITNLLPTGMARLTSPVAKLIDGFIKIKQQHSGFGALAIL